MVISRDRLASVLWIGGAPDSGKTSVAKVLHDTFGIPIYHYDQADVRHHERLAASISRYSQFLEADLDERWVRITPEALAQRAWQSFRDRWPYVVEDLAELVVSPQTRVIAEGFGLTPELVAPVLPDAHRAVWLVPTVPFKLASMKRRSKGLFAGLVSDPDRAARNLLTRDELLTDLIKSTAHAQRLTVIEVDGSQSVERTAGLIADHFGL